MIVSGSYEFSKFKIQLALGSYLHPCFQMMFQARCQLEVEHEKLSFIMVVWQSVTSSFGDGLLTSSSLARS